MNELAELLLTLVVGLPLLSAVAAAAPGEWWPDERRCWFSTFALAVAVLAASAIVSSPLWSGSSLSASIPIGDWQSAQDSAATVSLRVALNPVSASFVVALLLAGLWISLRLPAMASVQGRQCAVVSSLLIATGCATLVVAATNLLFQAAALVAATAAVGLVASWMQHSRSPGEGAARVAAAKWSMRDRSGGLNPRHGPWSAASAALPVTNVVLLLSVALAAAGGSLESRPTTAAISATRSEGAAPRKPTPPVSSTLIALGVTLAAGVRLALFPFLFEANRACRQPPLAEALRAGVIVPASAAFLFGSQNVLGHSPEIERGLLIAGGATVVLASWCAATSRTSRRAEAHLLSAGNGLLALAAATGDPRALPAAAAWLAFQSLAAVRAILRWNDASPEVEEDPESTDAARPVVSAPPARPGLSIVALGRATFHLQAFVMSAVALPWRLLSTVAAEGSALAAFASWRLLRFACDKAADVLEDLESEPGALALVGAVMAAGILLLTLGWR